MWQSLLTGAGVNISPMAIEKSRKKRIIQITAAVIALALVLILAWSFLIEPNRLVVKEETLELADWPSNFENLKIAVLSDLHVGSHYIDADKLQLIVQRVNETQPDL